MMLKLLLTTHWTVDEAETILSFLDELREVVQVGYEIELREARLHNNDSTEEEVPVYSLNDKEPF